MTTKTTAGYNYDITTNILTVTAAFVKKAAILGSPEYRIVQKYRAENPGLTIDKKTRKESTHDESKPRRLNIKYADMENYMNLCRNAVAFLTVYETVKKLSKGQPSPYNYVRTWFDTQFPLYGQQPVLDKDGFVIIDPKEAERVKAQTAAAADTHVVPFPVQNAANE